MYLFRLKSATMAIHNLGNSRTVLVIPQGAEIAAIDVPDSRTGFEHSRLIEIQWDGKTVSMFLLDLFERGERVKRLSTPPESVSPRNGPGGRQ